MTTYAHTSELTHEVLAQVERIAASELLRGSEALCRILRYLGNQAVLRPGVAVKEYRIATEALGRPAGFDPKVDACVRVNIGRLRSRLVRYYAGPGAKDPVVITIPRGSYALALREPERPQFAVTPVEARPGAAPASTKVLRGPSLSLVGLVATLCVMLGVLLGLVLTHSSVAAAIALPR